MVEHNGQYLEQVDEVKKEVRRFFEDSYKESSFSRPMLVGIEFQSLCLEDNSLLIASSVYRRGG